jgi:phospholipase/lecithinase/hemolysin
MKLASSINGFLLAGLALLASGSAHATSVGHIYYFGDSLTDCCWTQRYTNGGQPNWADELAPLIGANYVASKTTNFAIFGALAGAGNGNPLMASLIAHQNGGMESGFLAQVSRFRGTAAADDFAGIWIGMNDIWVSSYSASDPVMVGAFNRSDGIQPGVSDLTNYLIGKIQSGIDQLKAHGFRNIVLLSPYDMGQSAIEPSDPASVALARAYSDALTLAESRLITPGVKIYFVNVENVLRRVQADPGAYGFVHSTSTDSCLANKCTSEPLAVQNTYVFNDIIHTTSAFDELIAKEAAGVIEAGTTTPVPEKRGGGLRAIE